MADLKNTSITGSLQLPAGTTAQRPTNPPNGAMRFNTSLGYTEVYINRSWVDLSSSATGLPRTGMQLELSYDDPNSWPGNGTVWYDTSGNNRHFNISSNAPDSGQQAMNFSTNDRNAKYQVASTDLPGVPGSGGQCTYVCVTRILNDTSQWRTLTRSWNADHHIIIESGAWRVGMYDNDSAGFITAGYDQRNFWHYPDNYGVMVWRWQDSDQPTYALNVNNCASGLFCTSFNNSNARYNRGFSILGGYHDGSNDVNVGSQPWGWIKYFSVYNRRLSDDEVGLVMTCLRKRYNI